MLNNILEWCITGGIRILIAIIILIVGWIITDKLVKVIRRGKAFAKLDTTLASFLSSCINILFKTILIIICISLVGIPMASIVAILAAAGATIGLALQGGLSNIAGGILLLIFKPFKVGDFITSDGESGTVADIGIFYTKIKTIDNKTAIIPNGVVSGNKLVNYSDEEFRRVDLEFTVDYSSNINGILLLLNNISDNNEKVVSDENHSTDVRIISYSERGITIVTRSWCKSSDYWAVYFDLNKTVYDEFTKYGVKFAIPQMDVHLDK